MPVYNAEKHVKGAIDSMLTQTFRDFEFLILDDGSTDGTAKIVQTYTDPRIRFIQNEKNLGISKTLNKAIGLSRTSLLARMDADDISYPQRLQKQYDYLLANPACAMVSSLVKVISEDGAFVRADNFESRFLYYNLTFVCWIYHSTVMYRKEAVEAVGMYQVPYAEDFELFWQLSRKYVIYNLPEILLDYRVSDQSLHQVLKKEEYNHAQEAQLLRNFRYYAGEAFTLPTSQLHCLQHNFGPILERKDVTELIACFKALNYLTACIAAKENVNRDPKAIQEASLHKKNFLLDFFLQHFPKKDIARLFYETKDWDFLLFYLKYRTEKKGRIMKHKYLSFYYS